MSDFPRLWVSWVLDAASDLDCQARKTLLHACGERCAKTGVCGQYLEAFERAGRDTDAFFSRLNGIDGVSGAVVAAGAVYDIVFHECMCDLHTEGRVNSDIICDCSEGSVAYVMSVLLPDRRARVERMHTILGGADECRFRITIA